MNWTGAITRTIVAFLAIWILKVMFHTFPPVSLTGIAIMAVAIGILGYLADEMFGGYLSVYGRSLVGLVVATAVTSIAFTRFFYPSTHYFGYVWSAVAVGIVVGLGDLVLARFLQSPRVSHPDE